MVCHFGHNTRVAFIFRDKRTEVNNDHRKSLYCSSKYFPWESIHFWMRLNYIIVWTLLLRHLQNMDSEGSNWFFARRKTLTSHYQFIFLRIKEIIRCQLRTLRRKTHQSMFWVLKNWFVWADFLDKEWSVFGDWFSWFLRKYLANKWLCTTKIWLLGVVLVVRLRYVFPKKQATLCLKVLRARTTLVALAHLEIPLQILRALMRKSMIHDIMDMLL